MRAMRRELPDPLRSADPAAEPSSRIPFLQGYHPSPTDYRRFTRDGARKLMSPFTIDQVVNTRGSA
ncbi:MAG: hypothetical protein ACREQ9_13945, partial [Candidatus Binatia bacterium]